MVTAPTILIATTNPGKRREMESILASLAVHWVGLADYPAMPEPIEDADSFAGNAEIKALYDADRINGWAMADDSGLEVDALGGAPGVFSARYAGLPSNPAANNAKLVRELVDVPPQQRTARFRCAVVLAAPGRVIASASGCVEGVIVDQPRGSNGFGYDPHFLIPDRGLTAAELTPDEKNRISHRARAVGAVRLEIERFLRAASR